MVDNSHPNECEAVSHCGFDFISLTVSDTEHFSCACWPSVYLVWEKKKSVCLSPLPIFQSGGFLFLSCRSSLYILDIDPLLALWFVNVFSHAIGCLFTLLTVSFDA